MLTSFLNIAACGLLAFQGGRTPFTGFAFVLGEILILEEVGFPPFWEKGCIPHMLRVSPGDTGVKTYYIIFNFRLFFFFAFFLFWGFCNSQMHLLPKCYSKKQILIPSSFDTNVFLASCTSIC